MNSKELELYKLITMPDEDNREITYVNQSEWINDIDLEAQIDLNNICANRYKTTQIEQSSDPQTTQVNLNKNRRTQIMNDKELELYKLITMPDRDYRDITFCDDIFFSYVNQSEWINGIDFIIRIKKEYAKIFIDRLQTIFGHEFSINILFVENINITSNGTDIRINLSSLIKNYDDVKAQIDLNNMFSNRYKTPQIKQSSDPQTAQVSHKPYDVSDCVKSINKKKYSITNDEFELYKLIMISCKNNKFGWVNDTEFYIYVEYMHLEKFVNEFKRIFGDNVFEHVKLIGDIKSDELKIKLSKALAGCIDLNNLFPKDK